MNCPYGLICQYSDRRCIFSTSYLNFHGLLVIRKSRVMRQTRKRASDIFLDLAQMANGAASALGSLRSEMDVIRAGRADRQAAASGSVPREDFDAALSRIEALSARIAVLEARIDALAQTPPKTKTKSARPTKAKSAKKTKKA